MAAVGGGIRDVQRRAVRSEIAARAMDLFLEHGYEATTVEDVAAAAGVSIRTVFRYIATKEEMVVGAMGDLGAQIADRVAAAPPSDSPWAALVGGVQWFAQVLESGGETARARSRLLASTPQLRGALAEKHERWQDDITPVMTDRLSSAGDDDELQARAMVASVLACLDVAVSRWAFQAETDRTLVPLFRTAIATIARHD